MLTPLLQKINFTTFTEVGSRIRCHHHRNALSCTAFPKELQWALSPLRVVITVVTGKMKEKKISPLMYVLAVLFIEEVHYAVRYINL